MTEEYHPLMGLQSGDDLSRRRKTVADFLGKIPGLAKLFDILLPDGRGHPLASCSGSGHFWKAFVGGEDERLGAGARAKGNGSGRESVGAKGSPYPLIKAAGILRLPTCLVK